MNRGEQIQQLFAELQQTGSLERAVSHGLRLVCTATDCADAWLEDIDESILGKRGGAIHDLSSFVEVSSTMTDNLPLGMVPSNRSGDTIVARLRDHGHPRVCLPLRCGHRHLGTLVLVTSTEANEQAVQALVRPLDTLLATLLAAVPDTDINGVLTARAFRARIASEVDRAARHAEGFCVLHLRVRSCRLPKGDLVPPDDSVMADVGAGIRSLLRTSDAVGLMASDLLAILLTRTPPVGARIAQCRIQQFLAQLGCPSPPAIPAPLVPEFQITSFPDDATDVDGLCQAGDGGQERVQQALPLGKAT